MSTQSDSVEPPSRSNGRPLAARILGALALLLLTWSSFLVVPETETAIVTLFGRPTRTIEEAGFYLKWPIESRLRFDKRIQVYDPRPAEFLTRDKKNLVLDAAVVWRIAAPERFLRTVGDRTSAELRLHDLLWAHLAAAVGKAELSDLLSTEIERIRTGEVMTEVRTATARDAAERLGVEVLDVELKRLNFPEQNKQSVYARMRAERERIAREYRAQGEERALGIRAEADKEREKILAEAYREAETLRGKGEAEAAAIYARAYSTSPDFYRFLRTLESYRKILDEQTTVILSSDSPLLELLREGTP